MQMDAGGGKSHSSVFPPRCDFHAQLCVTEVALSNIKPQVKLSHYTPRRRLGGEEV
jgi:hypothetical protein